ncbi:hypothetical protein LZ554_001073 [Drepanopeziza brunnea f. sp. 'monogermtubi']|nr:hypothetical protein LZ554_001073 [Drepanopeziza brunnea f. sp. 'monogermtubi']
MGSFLNSMREVVPSSKRRVFQVFLYSILLTYRYTTLPNGLRISDLCPYGMTIFWKTICILAAVDLLATVFALGRSSAAETLPETNQGTEGGKTDEFWRRWTGAGQEDRW